MQTFVIASKYLQRKVQFDMYHSSPQNQEKPAQMILFNIGYSYPGDILYYEIPGSRHDTDTWKQALREFFRSLHIIFS